jgi:uncharacterized protein (TIGR02145 family)
MRTYIKSIVGIMFISLIFQSCEKATLPVLTTDKIDIQTLSTATGGGTITSDGGGSITERGLCWGPAQGPTTVDRTTSDGKGDGTFTSNLSGLTTNTTYYVRAYATNSAGTSYGNEVSFTLFLKAPGPSVSDVDGNSYNSVKIGDQVWVTKNLSTTRFNNNTEIPFVSGSMNWDPLSTPAYCWYFEGVWQPWCKDNYGALYNWYAVNTGKLCPAGWHVPTNSEWNKLFKYLGGPSVAGGKLKAEGTVLWADPNAGATNESGFTGLPGGLRLGNQFHGDREQGYWWSADQVDQFYIIVNNINFRTGALGASNLYLKNYGFSVRCLKD